MCVSLVFEYYSNPDTAAVEVGADGQVIDIEKEIPIEEIITSRRGEKRERESVVTHKHEHRHFPDVSYIGSSTFYIRCLPQDDQTGQELGVVNCILHF